MTEDGQHELVIKELRALRSACTSTVLTADLLAAHGPALVRLLGGGSAEAALLALQSLEIDALEDRFYDSALVAFGFGPYVGNQTDRWRQFLEKFDTLPQGEKRTARRWCDYAFDAMADWLLTRGTRPSHGVFLVIEERKFEDWHRFRIRLRAMGMAPRESVTYDLLLRYHGSDGEKRRSTDAVTIAARDGSVDWYSAPFSLAGGACNLSVTFPRLVLPYVAIHPPRARATTVDTMQTPTNLRLAISRSA